MKLFTYISLLLVSFCFFFEKGALAYTQHQFDKSPADLSIYVDIVATTWKTRGRIFYDVEGMLFRKLNAAGFKIVRKKQDPHTWILSVRYDEKKGAMYAVNKYGTVLRAAFSLYRKSSNVLWKLNVSEHSQNSVSGTPPYIDVLHKLETNPYYYFIGELLRKFVDQESTLDQALLGTLDQVAFQHSFAARESGLFERFKDFDHSMDSSQEFYLPVAMLRSIKKFVRCEDRRVIPVLLRLLHYPNERVRTGAREALVVLEAL